MSDQPADTGDRTGHGVECSGCGDVFAGVGHLVEHDCEPTQEATA